VRRNWMAAALVALLLTGCQKKQERQAESAIVSQSATPNSAFVTSLQVDPAQPKDGKPETFILTVRDKNRKPVEGAQITGELIMPLMDMGKNSFAMTDRGKGMYQGTGTANMSGEWEVQFTITANGATAKHGYHVVFGE
jgi:nitrogen fixation protein FixH